MAADTFARPIGFDHITGKSRAIDQLRLAEYSAKAVGAMARVSREDADVAELDEIGRASCRERVCQYVSISVVAGSLKKKNHNTMCMPPTAHKHISTETKN